MATIRLPPAPEIWHIRVQLEFNFALAWMALVRNNPARVAPIAQMDRAAVS